MIALVMTSPGEALTNIPSSILGLVDTTLERSIYVRLSQSGNHKAQRKLDVRT